MYALADLRVEAKDALPPSPGIQILSIPCICKENLTKVCVKDCRLHLGEILNPPLVGR